MDRLRVTKVGNVICFRQGKRFEGTLHLTAHHLIFQYHVPDADGKPSKRPKELWITYPMIAFCIYRPSSGSVYHRPTIRLRCRDFVFVALQFKDEVDGRAVYDSIKGLATKSGRLEKLYAFTYKPLGLEKEVNGWNVYDPHREFARQGVSPERGWRITNINADYSYSPTYPAVLAVPSAISDNVLNYAGRFRSRVRIPALSYLHPVNNCSITRSSQPLVGLAGNRSVQDERLVAAICNTSKIPTRTSKSVPATPIAGRSTTDLSGRSDTSTIVVPSLVSHDTAHDETSLDEEDLANEDEPKVYGATQHNLLIDARPTINAYANSIVGKGSENMDNYKCATKKNLGIANIHVMRKSLNAVIEAFKDTDLTPIPPNREQLAKSDWLKHIYTLLEGSNTIARTVGILHSHVLIHCSDGWDRTSQLSGLAQICLDPYFRTMEGFIVLVEKDWLSFGHMFRHRGGLLGSEKWFEIENERIGGGSERNASNPAAFGTAAGGGNAFENALSKAKGFFNQKEEASEDTSDSDIEAHVTDSLEIVGRKRASLQKQSKDEKIITKVKEISPVFHQFLDATYQILHQFPNRFEFNERFLRRLLYHLYSCQYGTFLYDSEKERFDSKAKERTRSVWDYFLSRKAEFINPDYDGTVDDSTPGKERLIFPRTDRIRWWAGSFGRSDAELNGPAPLASNIAAFTIPTSTTAANVNPSTTSLDRSWDFGNTSTIPNLVTTAHQSPASHAEVATAMPSYRIATPPPTAPQKITVHDPVRDPLGATSVSEGLPLDYDSTDISNFHSSDHPFSSSTNRRSEAGRQSSPADRIAAGLASFGISGRNSSPLAKRNGADQEMGSFGMS